MLMRIFQSLGFRLPGPLFLAVGGVLACYAVISFRSTEDHFLRLVRGDVERTSEMIKRATHDAMLTNRKDDVQAMISRLAETPDIAAIRIYDKTGRIVMSACAEEIGKRIAADTETCRACHQDDRTTKAATSQPGKRAHEELRPDVLRHLSAIETEPGCVASGCHAHTADQAVLGVLDLEMSTAPMATARATAKSHFLWATTILVVVILGVVAVFIRHGLQRPISRLCSGTRRIAQGDLDTPGQGLRARRAGRTGGGVQSHGGGSRRGPSRGNAVVAKPGMKVAEKTVELQQAQRQVLHMEKMASLGKLSATVAHEINNPLSGMLVYAGLSRRELQDQPLDPAVREEVMHYLCGDRARMPPLRWNRAESAALCPAERGQYGLGRCERGGPPEPDARRAPSAHEQPEAEGRVPRRGPPDHGRWRTVATGPGGPAGKCRRGHERPAGRARRTGRRPARQADSIQIDIGDNGIGIPSEVLPQIFEPFFSTKEAENGVWLGLVGGLRHHPAAWRPHRGRIPSRQRDDVSFDAATPRRGRSRSRVGRSATSPTMCNAGRWWDSFHAAHPAVGPVPRIFAVQTRKEN